MPHVPSTSSARIASCPRTFSPPRRGSRPADDGRSLAPAGAPADWRALTLRIRAGDPEAWTRLLRLVTGLLTRLGAYRLRESWEDICQEVIAVLVQSVEADRLREPAAFVAYAAALTRNRLVDCQTRQQRITSGGRRDESSLRAALPDVPAAPRVDSMLDLRSALERLCPRRRRAIEQIYLKGCTYQEAADALGVPLGTLKRLQTGGLRELRESLGVGDTGADRARA